MVNEQIYPVCPICGQECETIYRDENHVIVGCDECVSTANAWDVDECFPQEV